MARKRTADDIRADLLARGVRPKSNLRKAELEALLEETIASTATTSTAAPTSEEPLHSDFHRDVCQAYGEVVFWRANLCQVPSGKVGKDFVHEAANLLNTFNNNSENKKIAIMLLMLLFPLVLQKPSQDSKSRDHVIAIERRLTLFRAGDFQALLREGRLIQSRLPSLAGKARNAVRTFTRLMLHGKVGKALQAIRESDVAPVPVTPEVVSMLKQKHPPSADTDSILQGPLLPKIDCTFAHISAASVLKAAKTLSGSGGPSGADSDLWRHMLLSKKLRPASNELAQAISTFAVKLATETIDPHHLSAYVASRLIPLSKKPSGIRPIGIGEVLRRLVGKVITRSLKSDIIDSTAPMQVCAGLESGVEAAVHAARELFDSEKCQCVLLIDATNAFNSLNRKAALNNVHYICPDFATYLSNTYGLTSELFLCNGEKNVVIESAEGSTQGDTAALAMYASCLMPLITSLKDTNIEGVVDPMAPITSDTVTPIFYADDGLGGGKVSAVRRWWDKIKARGPGYGYFPNPRKSWLIVKPQYQDEAKSLFPDVNITTEGQRYLGSFIGTEEGKRQFVKNEVQKWAEEISTIAEIGRTEPQLAYSAYTVGISKRWSYLLRTTPDIADLLEPIEETITRDLLPAITGQAVINEKLRSLFALPARFGGLGIQNPIDVSDHEYTFSKLLTEDLSSAILNQRQSYTPEILKSTENKHLVRRSKNDLHQKAIDTIKQRSTPMEVRNIDLLQEKGASSWLTCLPLESLNFTLNRQEWYDAISARYNLPLVGNPLPEFCACGETNNIDHAVSCKLGGFVCYRHNNVRDYIAHELRGVCHDTKVEPHLLNVRGTSLPHGSITSDGARLDVSTRGFWGNMDCVYFDVRIFNPRTPSNSNQTIGKTYEKHENAKKTGYLQRVLQVEKATFSPLVMSTSGGLGKEFASVLKRLAEKKAAKTGYNYQDCIRYLRLRLSFAMVRSVTTSIRGHRGVRGRGTAENTEGPDDYLYKVD